MFQFVRGPPKPSESFFSIVDYDVHSSLTLCLFQNMSTRNSILIHFIDNNSTYVLRYTETPIFRCILLHRYYSPHSLFHSFCRFSLAPSICPGIFSLLLFSLSLSQNPLYLSTALCFLIFFSPLAPIICFHLFLSLFLFEYLQKSLSIFRFILVLFSFSLSFSLSFLFPSFIFSVFSTLTFSFYIFSPFSPGEVSYVCTYIYM